MFHFSYKGGQTQCVLPVPLTAHSHSSVNPLSEHPVCVILLCFQAFLHGYRVVSLISSVALRAPQGWHTAPVFSDSAELYLLDRTSSSSVGLVASPPSEPPLSSPRRESSFANFLCSEQHTTTVGRKHGCQCLFWCIVLALLFAF